MSIGAVSATGEMGEDEECVAVTFGVDSGVSGPMVVLMLFWEAPTSCLVGRD